MRLPFAQGFAAVSFACLVAATHFAHAQSGTQPAAPSLAAPGGSQEAAAAPAPSAPGAPGAAGTPAATVAEPAAPSTPVPESPKAASTTPAASAAPPPSRTKNFAFDVGAGTYFPLAFALEATAELPARILLQADLGYLPTPYSNTIVNVLGELGALGSAEETLVKTAIKNSLVARLSAGMRPFPKLGLEVTGGYTLATVGGGLSARDVISAYLESRGRARLPDQADREIPLHTTLHNFHVTVGWRFVIATHFVVRASLTYLQTFASSSRLDLNPSRPLVAAVADKVNREIDSFLNDYYTTYVKIPVIGVTAAYRF